eukprot:CAMPEP_0185192164 /NCGR_PEP_ID=MMETSP1140-20130426/17782_1 /TAXON_ID=298111 /ORGANISM="Pavlova sp., Strain CCMP459" /LENGTH=266 /DNA_ID=CAMNT_0027758895 /DNA_START=33 /DNA_END=833 /DNA_ORIENTATION=+
MRLGDAANTAVLLNTGLFMACVIGHALGRANFFSSSFMRDGFCVANKESRWTNSHIMSFYVDCVCTVILALLARRYKGMEGDEPVSRAAAGVFVHGLAHLGESSRLATPLTETRPKLVTGFEVADVAPGIAGLFLFFWFLLRSAPNTPSLHAAAWGLVHATVLVLAVPPTFGFTYVQTALLWTSVAYDLMRPSSKKDFFYDISALVVNLPIGLISWLEGWGCDVFFKAVGGHVLYDATIPACMFLYYAIVLQAQPKGKAVKAGKVE